MTNATASQAADALHLFERLPEPLPLIPKSTLKFLRGQPLWDGREKVSIGDVNATELSIEDESLVIDGTLNLRIALDVCFHVVGSASFESETAVLWIIADGERVDVELEELPGAEQLRFDYTDVEPILARLSKLI